VSEFFHWRADEPRERSSWLDAWSKWPDREVFAHPSFVALFAGPHDSAMCAALCSGEGNVLCPFIVRPLHHEQWIDGSLRDACDFISPYGYAGPFMWDVEDAEALGARFWDRFSDWARGVGAVSFFSRLPLFEEQRLPWPGGIIQRGENVVRSLDLEPEAMWMDYAHKVS
jgi:hypothetical protein